MKLREITRGITQWRNSLVDLADVHAVPRHRKVRKYPQHHGGSAAAAHAKHEAATLGDAASSVGRNQFGRSLRRRPGV